MIAEKIFQWRLTEHFKHRREPGTLYVTDLIYCPNRVVLEEQNPALAVSEVYNPTTITGSIIHVGLQTLLKEWFGAQAEVEGEMRIGETTIRGRIDALIGRTGVEIKTARSDTGIPQPHHIEQCTIYNTMFNLEKTVLIYLTPDRIAEYEVSKQYGEPEIIKLATSKQSPRYPWECQYCRYSILCSLKVVK